MLVTMAKPKVCLFFIPTLYTLNIFLWPVCGRTYPFRPSTKMLSHRCSPCEISLAAKGFQAFLKMILETAKDGQRKFL